MAEASRLHDILVGELAAFIPEGDFRTQCIYQPLPTLFARHSAKAGGNVMGLEHQRENGILFAIVAMLKTKEQEAFAYPKVKALIATLEEFVSAIEGGWIKWKYMNYADKSQDVLASYGEENVQKMKDAAAKYDPDGVFQRLVPGGFKISAI